MSAGIFPRPRVAGLLASAWERRVTLVVAGGGYGKTTALRQLAVTGPACWLGLRASDREVEVLAARIAEAIGAGSHPGVAAPSAPIGAADRRALAEGQAAVICESLDTRDEQLMLVLDDSDQLADEDSASQFLRALCLQAPSQLHIVLSGRRLPSLGLGAASGRGELLSVTAPDLAFTVEETRSLLVARLGPGAEILAEECWSLTGGWAAALQLIADRLERIEAGRWRHALEQLRQRRGQPWREFAADLIEREPPAAARILAIASVAPAVDPELLAALDVARASSELEGLQSRGLLVMSGEGNRRTLSPVLSEVVAERLPAAEAEELRDRTAAWLETSGQLWGALECRANGRRRETTSFARRHGRALIAQGYGARVAEVLRDAGTVDDIDLIAILGEALEAVGDWDGAMEMFRDVQRRTAGAPLAAGTAWRFGALLYLRGESESAEQVLSAAHLCDAETADDALISAWLSSTLWSRGEVNEASAKATVALRQAQQSSEPQAVAAAHVAMALAAASRGDREQNEQHYRVALAAAARAGDSVQLARIRANLSSRAIEEGDYERAIEEADKALSVGSGHGLFGALAMCNKAEALMHSGELDEARALLVGAIELFSSLGSLLACVPHTLLGALDRERGDLARARVSLERAHRLAAQADDAHTLVFALCGLARALAQDDPATARRHATEAATLATSLERSHALCAWSWVELCAGDRGLAGKLAADAESEARGTGDRPALAEALTLRGAACQPPDEVQLEAAAELWREVGDPIAEQRTLLMLAAIHDDSGAIERIRGELSKSGVWPELGVAGSLLAAREHAAELAITTLGRFAVLRDGEAVAVAAWQSRKARDLLKLLAARRGRPVTRDAAAEALWPNEPAGPLSNRLSVALSTLRRVLDPARSRPPEHYIWADGQSLALRVEHVRVDVIAFLEAAGEGVATASRGDWPAAETELRRAESLYTGDFLEEDSYEDWSVDCREEARSAALEVSRLLARAAAESGDDEDASRHLRRLLERDPYDGDAWTALVGAQLRLGRYGEARRQHAAYARRMAELAIAPLPLAATAERRP